MSIRPEKSVWDNTWGNQSEEVLISHADKKIFNYLIKEINPKDKEVIELGCGRGVLSYLLNKYNPKSITLMDFSKEALLRAKNIFSSLKEIYYLEGDLLNVKTKKKYDIVFSSGVVEHFSGNLRKQAIDKHFEISNDKVIFIVPARPHYNTIRHKKRKTIDAFGWQEAFSKDEMNDYSSIHNDFSITVSKRFYPLYGITLFELINIDNDKKIFTYFNSLLNIVNKILFKTKFYRILNFFLTPFENYIGGLLIVIAEKNHK
tara:strand:- start:561 stop:1340 length:780 start_codon:yes stop_codon:yes gene_type:complete